MSFRPVYSELEKKLCRLQSYKAISGILENDILHDLQSIDILKMIAHKKAIVLYDTGLGKTYLASTVIKMLHNRNPKMKFIMFVTKNQLLQTPQKIKKLTGLSVMSTDGEYDSVNSFINIALGYTVNLVTYSCLENQTFLDFLYENKNRYDCIFIDEAHKLNNFVKATTANIIYSMVKNFEYRYALTATPITTNLEQLARLASIFDYDTYHDYHKLELALKYKSYSMDDDPCFFINRCAKDFGRVTPPKGIIVWIDPMDYQREDDKTDIFKLCKGEGAEEQATDLAQLIKFNDGKRGLVYINRHATREWVLPYLDKYGITYRCINGKTSEKDRKHILKEFNENKSIDVIITSVTEALDLDCEYVIFYEFTVDIKQMIGRAQRGFADKKLFVFYMITRYTREVDYFYNNIFKRCELAAHVLHKDYSEITDLEDELLENLTCPVQFQYCG